MYRTFKQNNLKSIIRFVFFLYLNAQCILAQMDKDPEVRDPDKKLNPKRKAIVQNFVCAQYKKQLFESENTFAFLVHNAPEMKITVDNCKHYDPFVVGGVPATPKEFPPMASIGRNQNGNINWFCGGTLISKKYVLTAAHCFYSPYGVVNLIRLGDLDLSKKSDDASPEDFGAKQLIPHPGYNDDESLYNDIGLIELDREVTFDSYKHPACLPVADGSEYQDFVATGWGSTSFAGLPSSHLLKVKLERFNDQSCIRAATRVGQTLEKGLNINSQMCAGSTKPRDTCSGDSGGPLFGYHPRYPCLYVIVGVTSLGIGNCGQPNVPGIYTRVYYFMDWIKRYVQF